MKFEVKFDRGLYSLSVDGEKTIEDQKLSTIVKKIEAYLKMRYLKETDEKGWSKVVDYFKSQQNNSGEKLSK